MKAATIKEQIAVIKQAIETAKYSHQEHDGKVRDMGALHEILCLKTTLEILRALR
jgi:hypothetical protein